MSPILRTARLELRPYVPEDEEDFVALFGDSRVARWMGGAGSDDRALFRRIFNEETKPTWDIWAVLEDGVLIGHAELKPSRNPQVDGHELVYALAASVWGRGLGTELAEAITAYGLGPLGLGDVHATVDPDNARSLALLRKVGYAEVREFINPEDGKPVRLLTKHAPSLAS